MTQSTDADTIVARMEAAGVIAVIRTPDPSKLAPLFGAANDPTNPGAIEQRLQARC